MAALEASVAKAREDRGETPATVHPMPKKTAPKKATAKRARRRSRRHPRGAGNPPRSRGRRPVGSRIMDTASPAPIPVALYRPWLRIGAVIAGCCSVLSCALLWALGPEYRVFAAGWAAFGLWLLVHGPRAAVRVDQEGVTHRSLSHTRAVGWCSIRAVVPGRQKAGLLRTTAPELSLTNGRWLALHAIATRSAAATQANLDTLTNAHTAHRATCRT
ncbi:hypothetical protein ACIQKB_35880 [Streptomyces sp. NPDC092046]|uniref:hypothetical protein n=1 Tax=Streptomyces sp. NPDC092046 TaxID=3366009 RepID=UPI003800B22F